MPYAVSTPVFEGPFDLLLHLILKEQVDIYEVSLSTIVDAYLAEVERLQALDLDIATEFLLIASTLVELKARRLLPGRDDVDLDEELALWEERDLLLSRLLEAKTFKDVAAVFSRLADEADRSFPRIVGPDDRYIGLAADPLELNNLAADPAHAARLATLQPAALWYRCADTQGPRCGTNAFAGRAAPHSFHDRLWPGSDPLCRTSRS